MPPRASLDTCECPLETAVGNTFKEIYFLTQKDVQDDSVHKVVTK